MKRALLLLLAFTSLSIAHQAWSKPKPKHTLSKSSDQEALATNGWSYVRGEWIHPDGYKLVKGQVLRTTAKAGKLAPLPPGKLAQENAAKGIVPKPSATPAKSAAETAAEIKRKNLETRPAPQTGFHM
jgi:hypothetical protein